MLKSNFLSAMENYFFYVTVKAKFRQSSIAIGFNSLEQHLADDQVHRVDVVPKKQV